MFHRIPIEEWHRILTIVSLMIFVCVFLFVLLRVAVMPKEQRSRLEHMPLNDEKPGGPAV